MDWTGILVGIIPSIGVGLIFWFAMRAVVRADRNERAALADLDAQDAPGQGSDARGDDAAAASGADAERD